MKHCLPLGGSTGGSSTKTRRWLETKNVCNLAKKTLYDVIQLLGADV